LEFVKALNNAHPFLGSNESATSFVEVFNFGGAHQYYRHRFSMPKDEPTKWWRDGHQFKTTECFGLHESFKPFLKLLNFPLGEGAWDEEE
jgi:hypothetical protein